LQSVQHGSQLIQILYTLKPIK